MLPDLSPAHILIVVVVALIVVGPKDLPMLLRKVGQFVGKMRGMANEFRASFDEMARQSELDDLRKEVEAMRAAGQAAIPQNLGVEDALKSSDAESAYLSQWEASHAQPDDFLPGPPMTGAPPTGVEPALPAEPVAEAPKPARARSAKPKAEAGDAPKAAKPRARKAKPADGEADA